MLGWWLGLVNDWVGMWMGQVLQRVRLQGDDHFKVVRGQEWRQVLVRFGRSWVVCGS